MAEDDGYKRYLCEYPFKGSKWSFEIYAQSFEDADARIRQMTLASVKGEVALKVGAPNWFGRLFGVSK